MGALKVGASVAALVGGVLVESAAMRAVNNYMYSNTSGTPQIPLGKKKLGKSAPKIAKKEGLAKYSDAVNAGLAGVIGAVLAGSSTMSSTAEMVSNTNKTEMDALKLLNPQSPLLQNQLHLKQSVNDIVDAINSNTIASATFLAPINANLSAISSTLIAISSTLLEISDNYSNELESSDDLPYVDSQTFYDTLKKTGSNPNSVFNWEIGESQLVDRLSESGSSYSEIKQAVLEYRKITIPSKNLVQSTNSLSGITSPTRINTSTGEALPVTNPDYSSYLERLASHADSAKIVTDHAHTEQTLNDLDGLPVATMSPMQAKAIANATKARTATDTNSQEYDETDFPTMPGFPVLPFTPRSTILQKDPIEPTPLLTKILGLVGL